MELNLSVEHGLLLDIYGELLTEKMRDILKMYLFENMSYQEIANVYNISKPAVLDAIKTSQNKLLFYESKLKMLEFKKQINKILSEEDDVINKLNLLLKEY